MQMPTILLTNLADTMDLMTLLLVGLCCLMVGYRPPWWSKKRWRPRIRRIPGPAALPLLGTRWTFSWIGGYSLSRVHVFYRDMFRKYGSILKEEALWNVPVISVIERVDIEKVLKCSGRYPIRPPTEAVAHYRRSRPDRYATTGMVNEQGETWAHLRTNLTKDITSPQTIATFMPQVDEMANDLCSLIRNLRGRDDNGVAQVELVSRRVGLEIMCSLILGRRMGFLTPDGETDIARRLRIAVHHHFLACRDTYYGLPFWKLFKTAAYENLARSEEEVYDLASELASDVGDGAPESVVLESIMNARIDPKDKTAAIVDFIASGIHTLGNTLVFLLSLLAKRKDIQEIISVGRERGEYARACVKETFRLLPTAHCLARIVEKDLVLSGYPVGAGSVVVCHTGLACRDPKNFHRPDEFLPERWLGQERSASLSNSTFLVLPFGCGRRQCPGRRFIEQSLPVLLEHLVRNFVITHDRDIDLQFEFIMGPAGAVEMTFEDRC